MDGQHCYVVTSLRPSAVRLSLVCRFVSSESRALVLARWNRLEVHALAQDALVPVFDTSLYGKICSMEVIRLPGIALDCLFLLTDRKHFSVLRFDTSEGRVICVSSGNVGEQLGMELDGFPVGKVDPGQGVVGLFLQEGLLKVLPVEQGVFREAFNLRFDELTFIDVCFLHGCSRPTLCLLYEDHHRCRHVKSYQLDLKERELVTGPLLYKNVEHGAKILIPLSTGGVILVGQSSLTYFGGGGSVHAAVMEPTVVQCFGAIDEDSSRFLLGDLHGALYVLNVHRSSSSAVAGLSVERLGFTSIASSLSYLDNGIVFVGSTFGDNQLIRLVSDPDEEGHFVQVLEHYSNHGPIIDMVVVDSDHDGPSRLVTCSGSYKDGSIRVIRSGVGLFEQASMAMVGLTGVWALREHERAEFDSLLVQSFITETRVLRIAGAEMSEVEIPGFASEQSLYCGNAVGGLLVQVTQRRVRLIDEVSMQNVFELTPEKSITVATGNAHFIAVALAGGVVRLFSVNLDRVLEPKAEAVFEHDVACLSLYMAFESNVTFPVDDGGSRMDEGEASNKKSTLAPGMLAVGLWTDSSVRIMQLDSLEELLRTSGSDDSQLKAQAQARAVMLTRLGDCNSLSLLVGLGDGTLVVHSLSNSGAELTRRLALGTQPISLTQFSSKGGTCVFASCDRPTVIYGHNEKVSFSIVNFSAVTGMAAFHSELFPECLALISNSALTVAAVDDIRNVNVQTFPLHESPKRIAYSRMAAAFAVCSAHTSKSGQGEETRERLLILDDANNMSRAFTFDLYPLEQSLACECFEFEGVEYFVLGTAFSLPDESEPSRGRLLIFEPLQDKTLVLRLEREVSGAVFSLAVIGHRIFAAIGARTQVMRLSISEDGLRSLELLPECSVQGQVLSLVVRAIEDLVLVGDIVCSATLLRWLPEENKLVEEARDCSASTLRAIEFVNESRYIAADDCGNLFVLSADCNIDDKSRLGNSMEYHLGELINVIRRGKLNSQPRDANPTADENQYSSLLCGCVSGAVVTALTISESNYRFFSLLQKCLAKVVKVLGGMDHDEWRCFQNDRRLGSQMNAIDGDLVEKFLELGRDDMESVVRQLNFELQASAVSFTGAIAERDVGLNLSALPPAPITLGEVIRRVEEINSLH